MKISITIGYRGLICKFIDIFSLYVCVCVCVYVYMFVCAVVKCDYVRKFR